ncbi:sensor histidine kinase [Cohnella sp.]|uniref:sensor histidine kinase n=1 Tax=Cohnella sp. TaxID=1883426 RepID=UPI003561398C
MRLPLVWLQHLLIAVPAIATLYEADIPSVGKYVACILLALLYSRLLPLARKYAMLLIPLGMIAFSWLFHEYGGLLYFLQYSLLVSAVLLLNKPAELGLAIVLSGAALNSGAFGLPSDTIWTMNVAWLTVALFVAGVFVQQRQSDRQEKEMESLAGSQDQLEQERARAMEYARKVEDYAQVQERSRIATELHDDLGHRLIRVKMMTEAALQLMERNPGQAAGLIEQVRRQLEESMNNMRYTVRKLQPVDSAGARRYALHRLIEDAARDLRIEVDFAVTGNPYPLYPSLEFVLYRNAQEAITNAVRHGGANAVEVELRFAEDQIAMNISNNGTEPDRIAPGLGLKGMQDRLAVVGGRLRIETNPRFVLSTIVPYSRSRPAPEKELSL